MYIEYTDIAYNKIKETIVLLLFLESCDYVKYKFYKYLYFSIQLALIPFLIAGLCFGMFSNFLGTETNYSSIVSLSGTFIGFLLTVMTLFFTIDSKSQFMKNIIAQKHHLIFLRCVVMGIVSYFTTIILWLFGSSTMEIALYFFIAGCLEVAGTLYYLYFMIINRFVKL